MKVCLISLPSPFLIEEKVFPNLGVLYLASYLKERGLYVKVHDEEISKIPAGYDFYGISTTTSQFPQAKLALQEIRDKSASPVIIGGAHPTVDPESCNEFDHVIRGFGEDRLCDILGGSKLKVLEGLDLEKPIEEYPLPDRNAIDIKSYKYEIDGIPATTLLTGRGCPYACAFCANVQKVKLRQAWHVIYEFEHLYHDYGFKAFMIFDDIFIAARKRAMEIFQAIKQYKFAIRCFVRADLIVKFGDTFVKAMADAGVREVGMGVESGSDRILRTVNKREDTRTVAHAVHMLHEAKIRVKGFFIVGLPGESRDTIEETRRFIRNTRFDDVDFTIFQPYKGSHIFNNKDQYDIDWGLIEDSWYKGKPEEYVSNVWTSGLSKEDIVNIRIELEREFKNWGCHVKEA